jgi:hypothetical protein
VQYSVKLLFFHQFRVFCSFWYCLSRKHSFNAMYMTCIFSFQSCSHHYRCLGSWNWRTASVFGHKLRFTKQSRIVHPQVVTYMKKLIINFIFVKLSSKRWWHIVNVYVFASPGLRFDMWYMSSFIAVNSCSLAQVVSYWPVMLEAQV